jgi:hypothetical protein
MTAVSVTASYTTGSAFVLHVTIPPSPNENIPATVHGHGNPITAHVFRFVMKPLVCFKFRYMPLLTSQFSGKQCADIFLWQTRIPTTDADVESLESCTEGQLPLVTVSYSPWELPQTLDHTGFKQRRVLECFCFPARCALHSADRFQAFVLFSFAFCSHTEPSTVSTDHYFCCFVLWTHRLHLQTILWVKEWNKFWWQFNFLQYCNTVLFHTGFHSAIETAIIVLLKGTERC